MLCEFLVEHGQPQPPAIILRSIAQAEMEMSRLTFPVLFKPATSGCGIGIRTFVDAATLLSFLRTAWRPESPALVQSYIPGHDVDCSVLCQSGKIMAHTIQISFLPRRSQFGSDEAIEFIRDPQTLAATARLMSALNWSGIAHVDLRHDQRDGQVKVLDFSPRYWTSLLGSLAAGVNFPYLSCLAALGIGFTPPVPVLRKFFTADAAFGHVLGKCVGRRGSKITLKESGLAYAFSDPGPRVFRIMKNALSVLERR
jgi:predicted ATP-grasp superfamily ATP-dependent carboligase